uniref:Uncharacterized protein n=1 Tax=Coccidioides posadasii RMSCC 3488 TaxID=454284 RepID=A0A0J6HZJ1_COCPO|nr:hypothetical protein CPAG_00759 [Coccidioides posadasii RMSCC 3488]
MSPLQLLGSDLRCSDEELFHLILTRKLFGLRGERELARTLGSNARLVILAHPESAQPRPGFKVLDRRRMTRTFEKRRDNPVEKTMTMIDAFPTEEEILVRMARNPSSHKSSCAHLHPPDNTLTSIDFWSGGLTSSQVDRSLHHEIAPERK